MIMNQSTKLFMKTLIYNVVAWGSSKPQIMIFEE